MGRRRDVPGVVYLLHFIDAYRHARHYLGWTDNLPGRLADHVAGRGARLTAVVLDAGIGLMLARTWPGETRGDERRRKGRGLTPFCPVCRALAAGYELPVCWTYTPNVERTPPMATVTTPSTPRAAGEWPPTTVGKGPAMNKREAAERLGWTSVSGIDAAIRRTRIGTARVGFPTEDGYAIHPASARRTMVPYWYERTIVAYGKAANILGPDGKPLDGPAVVDQAA